MVAREPLKSTLGEPAAAEQFWTRLTAGGYLVAWYSIWHHRLLQAPARPGRYANLAPDGDVYACRWEKNHPTHCQFVNEGG